MIQVQNLSRYYGAFKAIEDVSFEVAKGEILGFLGPNAAGKTTTMRIITGYLPATYGTARVAGYDVLEQPLEVKRRIGYLPENPPLYLDMTVRDYLDFASKIKGVPAEDREKRIESVMTRTAIRDVADSLIKKLSKGYRQRVGLAQALVHDPPVLILDEPTIGLDPRQIIEVRELIKSLAGERTVILSTHILPEVSMTCDRVVIINRGRVVAEDTPENLTARISGSEKLQLEVEAPKEELLETIRKMDGVSHAEVTEKRDGRWVLTVENQKGRDVRRELAETVIKQNWGLYEMRRLGASLEDVFLHLITEEQEVG